jgi:hypothetical protein
MVATGPPDLEYAAAQPGDQGTPPVAGYNGWWDASDAASISGGVGNTAATWRDKTAGARHLTQATDAKRPFTGGLSQNGLNVLVATVAATEMNGNTPVTAHPYTIFLVAACTTGDATQRSIWSGLYSSGAEWGRVYRPTSNLIALYNSGGPISSQTWERNRPRVVTGVFNGGGSLVSVDGRYVNSASAATGGSSAGHTVLGFGPSESWIGWLGEMIIYTRALSAAEYARVERYLLQKWGLT